MSETAREEVKNCYLTPEESQKIVISGIAGRFPACDNVNILRDKLMNKEDLVSNECRWQECHPEIPPRMGKVNNIEKFDATFFGVHPKQVQSMDPQSRTLLEHTFEAIMDAGVNPNTLRGKNIAVIVGVCYSETEKTWFYEKTDAGGMGLTGCSRAMFANRISYFFDFHGPSYTVDSACSSSLFALEQAYRLIEDGRCEAAIIAGANMCLHPNMTLLYKRLGVLSPDGSCKTFDEDANGYVRSEAVAVAFLQKAKDAKRIYSTVVHAKTNSDGYKVRGITYPSRNIQGKLMQDFYEECQISPHIVSYLECHGTGTAVGDPVELSVVSKVFCTSRTTPLMIGSIKSNLGHSESASGLCGIVKVIIAMETGIIPPNLHLKKPRKTIKETQMIPIMDPTPWKADYAAINAFGFGGANAHILLKPWKKEKINNGAPCDNLPRVVVVSGRTENTVEQLLQDIQNRPLDVEYVALLHNIYSVNIPAYSYRGYTIVDNKISNTPIREVQFCENTHRPVWYCFSGMGSQWIGMGEGLLKFPVFAKAIKTCDNALRPYGINIFNIILARDEGIFNSVVNSFVGIAAIQIGLVDLLTEVGLIPTNLIGHSVGELGCAYADGSLTAEQTVLAAYCRGIATKESDLIFGAMAAVGFGYKKLQNKCPPDIDIACHNSSTSSTISGPAESVKNFVAELQKQKIFAREVATSNIAYHSRYIANAGPKLLARLKKTIPNPKPRSEKWMSTSVPKEKWFTPEAKLCSAEYFTNNLLSSVLFEETAELIPADAIVIEIAPHGLLQAILKTALKPTVTNIPLTLRGHMDNAEFFVQALGKLYNAGVELQLANLYPSVEFPVSRGTPMIAPHIRWNHSEDWFVSGSNDMGFFPAERTVNIHPEHEQYAYMMDHIIDCRSLISAASYIFFVWETYAMTLRKAYGELSVVFENLRFERAVSLQRTAPTDITIIIHRGDGKFEITEKGNRIASGIIRGLLNPAKEKLSRDYLSKITSEEVLSKKDFYKELRLRGYNYQGLFRGVESCSITGNKAHLAWSNNWVTFIDTMLQVQILSSPFRELLVPTSIRKIVIDVEQHYNVTETLTAENNKIPAFAYKNFNAVVSGGIEIHALQTSKINRRREMSVPVIDEHRFVAYRDKAEISLNDMAQICIDLCVETEQVNILKILELVEDHDMPAEQLVIPLFMKKIDILPLTSSIPIIATSLQQLPLDALPSDVTVINAKNLPNDGSIHIAAGYQLFNKRRIKFVLQLLNALNNRGFLFTQESTVNDETIKSIQQLGLVIIFEKRLGKQTLLFLRKRQKLVQNVDVIHADTENFDWIERVKTHMQNEAKSETKDTRVILVSHDPDSGIIGFTNCARKEPNGEGIKTVLILDQNAPKFSLENALYSDQLVLDLPFNVLRGSVWGCYRHLQIASVKPKPCHHIVISQETRGDLTSLRWVEGPLCVQRLSDNIIRIAYASLNFKDVMLATGKLSLNTIQRRVDQPEDPLGFEYSGLDSEGKRVMGFFDSTSCMSNLVVADNMFQFDVPDNWTLQEAATVPCVYLTCISALYMRANMKKRDKVLIHAGSGGVGQAAINLALAEGCEVFTTVGTPEKRKFIRETYPSIKDDHIGNSRDTSFEQMIMKMTDGRGVDIVLNSLAEEKLQASMRCLARRGRFLEIGKYDIGINSELGMYVFLKEITFHSIMLDALTFFIDDNTHELRKMMIDMIRCQKIKPIVSKCFSIDEVEEAFRYMAAGKHIGKILIKIREENGTISRPLLGYSRYYCKPNSSYVLFGGLGGLGLELAHWLYSRGARNIVFVSRNGIVNGYQRMRVEKLKTYGANAIVVSGRDASEHDGCNEILKCVTRLAPVDGIFNLAVCLRDSLLINQTKKTFAECVKPKAWITKRLDELSRTLCPELRHFVVFSSVSCGKGNPGQTNYGFANSVMERICERRRREGLPGLAIQWGAIGEVGIVAEKQQAGEELIIAGTLQQSVISCFEEFDKFLSQDRPVVSSMLVSDKSKSDFAGSTPAETVMSIMGVKDMKSINQKRSLAELGVDSMMVVEIKQTLERDFDVCLSLQEIRNLNFAKLTEPSTLIEHNRAKVPDKNEIDSVMFVNIHEMIDVVNSDLKDFNDCVDVPTLATDKITQAFIISGINSDISAFSSFWPKLKCPTKCIRLPFNLVYDTIEKVLDYFMKYVLEGMRNRKKFLVAAYSAGAIFGIEIVRKLEKLGFSGQLILIDSSPQYLKAIKTRIPSITEDFYTNLMLFILSSSNIFMSSQVISEASKHTTLKQKAEIIYKEYKTYNPKANVEDFKLTLSLIHKRVEFIEEYNPACLPPLETPIALLKPSEMLVQQTQSDYGLAQLTRANVDVHELQGNHRTILQNERIALIINDAVTRNESTTTSM